MKLNKYLPGLEKVFQEYAIEASSRLGLNNFIRFLKEYQLLSKHQGELGMLTNKKGTESVLEYRKLTTERAQIVFKQANSRLNFE